jgi:hypothetical protein
MAGWNCQETVGQVPQTTKPIIAEEFSLNARYLVRNAERINYGTVW